MSPEEIFSHLASSCLLIVSVLYHARRYNSNQNSLTQSLEELITNNPGKVKKWLSTLDPVRWADEGLNLIKNDVYNFDAKPSGLFQAGQSLLYLSLL